MPSVSPSVSQVSGLSNVVQYGTHGTRKRHQPVFFKQFSMHGLSRLFHGTPKERICWLFMLVFSISFLAYNIHNFHIEYEKFEMRTEIRVVDKDSMRFPDVVICDLDSWNSNPSGIFCHRNMSIRKGISCNKHNFTLNVTTYPPSKVEKYVDIPGACYRIRNNNISITSNLEDFGIDIGNSKASNNSILWIFFIDQQEEVINPWRLATSYGNHINVKIWERKVVHRLQYPFPANCSFGKEIDNIFPGNYTKTKCEDTCLAKKLLKTCGTVPDPWKSLVLDPSNYKTMMHEFLGMATMQMSAKQVRRCLNKEVNTNYNSVSCYCPPSCYEVIYSTVADHEKIDESKRLTLRMFHPTRSMTEVFEIPAYPITKLFSDIGSWCGLIVGMSFLSLVEIGSFLLVAITNLIKRDRRGPLNLCDIDSICIY